MCLKAAHPNHYLRRKMYFETTLYSRIGCTGGDYNTSHEKFQYKADMNFGIAILAGILFIIIKVFNLGRI